MWIGLYPKPFIDRLDTSVDHGDDPASTPSTTPRFAIAAAGGADAESGAAADAQRLTVDAAAPGVEATGTLVLPDVPVRCGAR